MGDSFHEHRQQLNMGNVPGRLRDEVGIAYC
jgi:hypothetical protein